MKIFVIVGMPAAGKNIGRIYAESNRYPYYATGDLVRAEVRRRGFDADAMHMAAVSTELRGEDGMGVTRIALDTALKEESPVVFLEGSRSLVTERLRRNAEAEGRGIVLRLEGLVRARVRARLGGFFSDSETEAGETDRAGPERSAAGVASAGSTAVAGLRTRPKPSWARSGDPAQRLGLAGARTPRSAPRR